MTKIALDIGCGLPSDYDPGNWIRVDPFAEGADIKAFAHQLPFEDSSVDAIYSSHMLEHVSKIEVLFILEEWWRVLKFQGKLTLRVPDLAWCCQWWLNHQTNGWDMDILFGNQSREGEFHKTGFSREIMVDYLRQANFQIKQFNELETHDQKTLEFICIK